jgi:hypothetical protein
VTARRPGTSWKNGELTEAGFIQWMKMVEATLARIEHKLDLVIDEIDFGEDEDEGAPDMHDVAGEILENLADKVRKRTRR